MRTVSRRMFLTTTSAAAIGSGLSLFAPPAASQIPGDRPTRSGDVAILNPRTRIPISLIIDDSTCLVNLNRFAVPQFASAWGNSNDAFQLPWRQWPPEISDRFVRKFGEWCGEHGVKGKYSVVPYPACVGRLDRGLPGWTDQELQDSIQLVRTLMLPNWDIHPEMVTHTWVIDTRTNQPHPQRTLAFQENWDWTNGRSVDELSDYLSYALRILKNVGLPCEGITTPGGFGLRVLPELAQATLQSCRDVFQTEIPHYFRHGFSSGADSVTPRVEYAAQLQGPHPQCVVSIVACTGDWTGGWDCVAPPEPDRFISADLQTGRVVDVIERGEPACLVCHWTGIYFNGEELGFQAFQEVVRRLHARYDNLIWMKLSEIARYWAAKELTRIEATHDTISFDAPFATPQFTVRVGTRDDAVPTLQAAEHPLPMQRVDRTSQLRSQTWFRDAQGLVVCFDLPEANRSSSLVGPPNLRRLVESPRMWRKLSPLCGGKSDVFAPLSGFRWCRGD